MKLLRTKMPKASNQFNKLLLAIAAAVDLESTQRAVAAHDFNSPWPHSDKLSMCSSSSGHVITPGVESGATKSGHVHLGKAPTSLHMSTQTPANLFCKAARTLVSAARQASSLDAVWS